VGQGTINVIESITFHAEDGSYPDSTLSISTTNQPSDTEPFIYFGTQGDDDISSGKAFAEIYLNDGDDKATFGEGGGYAWLGNGNDILIGGSGNEHLRGGAGNDTLSSGSGDDRLYGEDGDDTLIQSGSGAQHFDGGSGIDTYKIDTVVWADLILPTIEVNLETGFSGLSDDKDHPKTDTVTNIENVVWDNVSWDLLLVGNDQDNILTGGSGNDTLDGGAGNDTLSGGAGNDIYMYAYDGVTTISDTSGTDTLYLTTRDAGVTSDKWQHGGYYSGNDLIIPSPCNSDSAGIPK
jgi:Ca2+-binding RTX toxin-like protein